MLNLIWIDYCLISLVGFYILSGLQKGFSLACFAIICWSVAIGVGLFYSGDCSILLTDHINSPSTRIAAAFCLLFLLTQTVGLIIRLILGELLNSQKPTVFSRLGGMVLGAFQGLMSANLLVLLIGLSPLPDSIWWGQAKLVPPFQVVAIKVLRYFPTELARFAHFH